MDPVYECRDSQPGLSVGIVLVGIMMLAMSVLVPNDPTEPAWIMWVLRAVLVFFGALTLVVVPMVKTKVFAEYVEVQYGLTNLIKFRLAISKIKSARAVVYSPLIEFGGWGIKSGGGKYAGYTAFTASITNKALAIETIEKNYIIGCSDPEEAEVMIRNLLGKKRAASMN